MGYIKWQIAQTVMYDINSSFLYRFFCSALIDWLKMTNNRVAGWPRLVPKWLTFGLRLRWHRSVSWWSCLCRAPSAPRWTYSCPCQSDPNSLCIAVISTQSQLHWCRQGLEVGGTQFCVAPNFVLCPANAGAQLGHSDTAGNTEIVKITGVTSNAIGSTVCALTLLLHHVTATLERCSYVRCLMIDFSKAFDRVDHPTLLAKLNKLDLPPHAINWIISYLSGRSQILKCQGQLSARAEINTIVQGSGIGPMLFVVMESDLSTMSSVNILLKSRVY